MITGRQIRAARALLGWDAATLAERAGLTRETVSNVENGLTQGRGNTLDKMQRVFETSGVEFVADRGVALKNENYRLLEGSDCYLKLLDEIFHTLRDNKNNSEVLSICTDDSMSPPEVVTAIQRWHDAGIKCRFLSHDRATRFDFPREEYRLIGSRFFKNSVMLVYEDKVATLRGTNDAVLIIHDRDQAEMLRGLFELIWTQTPMPDVSQS